MILAYFAVGELIDSSMPGSFTMPYKVLGGLLSAGLILFVARKMKGVVLRRPIRRE